MIFILTVLAILILAGCVGEDRRGNPCKTNADCSWCDSDQFAYNGQCETYGKEKACGLAVTKSCKRAEGSDSKCVLSGGLPICTKSEQSVQADVTTVSIESFAKCLNDKGAVMYGAMQTCQDTQAQSRLFGDRFQDINYKEVNEYRGYDPIKETPTWVIGGKLYPGKKSFSQLADLTGCTAP